MFKVLVTRRIPEAGLKLLTGECEVEMNPYNRVFTHREISNRIKDKDGLVCLLTDRIDQEIIENGKNLKVISNYAVGYDNIDIESANRRGIPVTNTPDVLTDATADLTWALILSIARRIVESDSFTRARKFKSWDPLLLLGSEVYGKVLGIIGAGKIGTAVAKRSQGFSMKLLYTDPNRNEIMEKEFGARNVNLKELLKESDFVTTHTPLLDETYHIIGRDELRLMKKDSFLINTSRGNVIDEKELVKALKEKRIRGAALDVFENEPEIEPELLKLKNVILLPHIGSATVEARSRMSVVAAKNLLTGLKGEIPQHTVNLGVGD